MEPGKLLDKGSLYGDIPIQHRHGNTNGQEKADGAHGYGNGCRQLAIASGNHADDYEGYSRQERNQPGMLQSK